MTISGGSLSGNNINKYLCAYNIIRYNCINLFYLLESFFYHFLMRSH